MFLLIDNYDSFTYNLYHYLGELGAAVSVVRNDQITIEQVFERDLDGVILSPGPCTPNEAGICLELLDHAARRRLPVLGVCLGHQAIGQAFGGKVIQAPLPVHGKTSAIHHRSLNVFAGLPTPFLATRYHSLIVDGNSVPHELEVTARTEDGLIMGLAHKELPIMGVQFHPESIASDHGHALLRNFLTIARGDPLPLSAERAA